MTFDAMWQSLLGVGRRPGGGYRRFAWTAEDAELREWFTAESARRGLDLVRDRAGSLWAWWGDPDRATREGRPGVGIGSHLDSVPDGGAFDGPLGVVSAFAAVDLLQGEGFRPARPIGVAAFVDEEGARFGIACAGSRVITGVLDADRARALADVDGVSLAEAMRAAGLSPDDLGPDPETLRRIGCFVELHVEQGRGLIDLGHPLGVGSRIWPHGRWRFELRGRADHAGTTRLADRHDPMLALATVITRTRALAETHGVLATCGKVAVSPNGVNAIPSRVIGWLDARGDDEQAVRALVDGLRSELELLGGTLAEESWTPPTPFHGGLTARVARVLGDPPVLPTGAGHDAGILAGAGIPTAMIFVRNPTGVSHAPDEYAEPADCRAGVLGLADVLRELAS